MQMGFADDNGDENLDYVADENNKSRFSVPFLCTVCGFLFIDRKDSEGSSCTRCDSIMSLNISEETRNSMLSKRKQELEQLMSGTPDMKKGN